MIYWAIGEPVNVCSIAVSDRLENIVGTWGYPGYQYILLFLYLMFSIVLFFMIVWFSVYQYFVHSISSFSAMFAILSQTIVTMWATFNLSGNDSIWTCLGFCYLLKRPIPG